MKNLSGRNALLTGASRGLGPHIARALAREGVNLALTARTAEALRLTAAELAPLGVRTATVAADACDRPARERLVQRAVEEIGPLDILINNAGVERLSRYTSLSTEEIATMVETNLVAPLVLARLVLPAMLARGSGHIVMMSSLGGKKGSPYSATYSATKAAMIAWTDGLREELRGSGVGVSVVCPGFVSQTGMFAAYGKRAPRIMGETTPQEVAAAVVRAIKRDLGEIIVNPGPTRLMLLADAVSPGLTRRVLRRFGLYEFFRRQAEENERLASAAADRHPPAPDR